VFLIDVNGNTWFAVIWPTEVDGLGLLLLKGKVVPKILGDKDCTKIMYSFISINNILQFILYNHFICMDFVFELQKLKLLHLKV